MAEDVAEKPKRIPITQVATALNDITIPFFTDVLSPLDDILIHRGGVQALKLYDELERDAHVFAVLTKRKHHLIAREWTVEAGGESAIDVKAADFVRDALGTLPFDQVCLDLLDATLKGYAISEAVWVRDGGHLRPDRLVSLEQRRFVFDVDWKPRLLTQSNLWGEKLPDRKFVVHRFGVKGNNPYGVGLGAKLFWPVQFKRQGFAFWLRYMERFASPVPIGKYPAGTSEAEIDLLMRMLEELSNRSSIGIPLGTELDTFEARRTGSGEYDPFTRTMNSEISKAVLGETLTTEMGANGARAASDTHHDILDILVDGDADLLTGTLRNQLVRWMVEANYPGAALPSLWRPRVSDEMADEKLLETRARRRSAEFEALEAARRSGFEPADRTEFAEESLGGPVVEVERTPPPAPPGLEAPAQKKSPMIRLLPSP